MSTSKNSTMVTFTLFLAFFLIFLVFVCFGSYLIPSVKHEKTEDSRVMFCSGFTVLHGKSINYEIFSPDNGVSWWVIKGPVGHRKLVGPIDKIYPGLKEDRQFWDAAIALAKLDNTLR